MSSWAPSTTFLQPLPPSPSTMSPSPPPHCEAPGYSWTRREEELPTQVVVASQPECHTLHSQPAPVPHTLLPVASQEELVFF